MGRYYSGDIDGKFWFGVQSSIDADFFGVKHYEPNYVEYYFKEEHIPLVKKGIKECEKELGKYKTMFDKFFKEHDGYNDKMLIDYGFPENKIKTLLEWYARLELGQKILECLKKYGSCQFQAEL